MPPQPDAGRPHHALVIPSMVDLNEFHPRDRETIRREWGVGDTTRIGWVGRLIRKKRVEDVIQAFARIVPTWPEALLVIVGGPDAFMPEYVDELRGLARELKLAERVASSAIGQTCRGSWPGSTYWCGSRRGRGCRMS